MENQELIKDIENIINKTSDLKTLIKKVKESYNGAHVDVNVNTGVMHIVIQVILK